MSPVADLSGVVANLSTGSYTVTRNATGTMTAGRYTAGTASTFDITASVQPTSGRDLKQLSEGQRTEEMRAVFTSTELRTTDTISISGSTWLVQKVEDLSGLGNYFKAIVGKVEK